jgi:outer membrane translocation and assembly module TamA
VFPSGTRLEGRIEKKLSSKLTGIYRLYHLERTKTEVLNDPTSEKIEVIGSTGPTLIVDLRDDIFNPTKGSLHTFGVELASPLLLSNSNISFVLASLRNTFFIPVLPSLGLTLFAGGSYAKSLLSDQPLPNARLDSDLSLGGRNSMRGYSLRRFSPRGSLDPIISETAFYNFRAELNYEFVTNWGAAVFFDTGQLYPNWKPQARHDGIGVGLRYKTPVGPVVVDVAQGLGPDKESIKFYFTVGTL